MRLLESKPDKKKRSPGGTIFSIVLHLSILFLAIFATARAGARKAEKPRETKVSFVAVKKEEPPPPKKEPPPPKEAPKPKAPPKVVDVPKLPKQVAPAPPQGFKVLAPPVNIPTNLPVIDLSKAVTNAQDFSGKGVAGGSDNGVKGGTGKEGDTGKSAGVEDHGPYMEFQVEKPVEKNRRRRPGIPILAERIGRRRRSARAVRSERERPIRVGHAQDPQVKQSGVYRRREGCAPPYEILGGADRGQEGSAARADAVSVPSREVTSNPITTQPRGFSSAALPLLRCTIAGTRKFEL